MARDNFGVEPDIGWIGRKFRELDGAIAALRSERRAEATTVNGGNWIIDGGDVLMLDVDGTVMFRLGQQTFGDRGFELSRENGQVAISLRKGLELTEQDIQIHDASGNLIFAEEVLGSGLSHPFLHIPMVPVQTTPGMLPTGPYGVEVPIATGTFTTTHQAWYPRHNQYGFFQTQIAASDATTAAEVRVINTADNAVLGAFFALGWTGTRAAGSTNYVQVDSPSLLVPGMTDQRISLALQVRRSAGAGTLQVALIDSAGR